MNSDNKFTKSIINGKYRNSPFKMNYTIFGNGPEKVIFIMGYMLRGKYWKSTIKNYINQPDKYQICIFDQCGTGNSEMKLFTNYNELASDVNELLDNLKWDKTNVIALSAGTLVANELSKISPNKIKTLTLMSMPQFNSFLGIFKLLTKGINHFLFIKLNSILYDVNPLTMFSHLYISDKYYKSPSLIKQVGNNGDYVIPLLNKLYNDIYNAKPYLMFCHLISCLKYQTRPHYLTKDQVLSRPFPILMYYGSYDPLMNLKKSFSNYEIIQPNLIYHCKGAGHCLNFEEIDLVYEKTTKFINENKNYQNENKQFLKVECLNFNSNGSSGKTYNQLYKSTKFLNLPFFENLKRKSNLLFDLNKKKQLLLSFAFTLIKK